MALLVVLTPEARDQALEADLSWRGHREKAPDLFEEELESAVALLRSQPELGRR